MLLNALFVTIEIKKMSEFKVPFKDLGIVMQADPVQSFLETVVGCDE